MSINTLSSKFNILSIGIEDSYSYVEKQQIRNTNQSSLISFVFGLLSTLSTTFLVPAPYIYIPLVCCFLYLLGITLNYFKFHKLADAFPWIISNLLFFWLANSYGKESNAYLLFILAEIVCIFNFDLANKQTVIYILSVPILESVISFLTGFKLFMIPSILPMQREALSPVMFFMTILGCALAAWLYRYHLQKHISSLEKTKEMLEIKYEEMERINEELRRTNEELDKFVYSVSHDLRAPITSIMGLLDLCETDKQNVETYLQLQRKSIVRLDSFIKDILHYARNSRLPITPVEINFEKNIQEIFADQSHSDLAKEIDIRVSVVKENSVFFTDEFRLNVILANLISNSIRYRKINAKDSYILCEIQVNDKEAKIVISDNGIGIPEKYLPLIFRMFYRANTKSTGSGLGLYIVKEAVNKMGGSIKVESQEGVGTTFTLTIPNLLHRAENVLVSAPQAVEPV